MPAPKLRVAFTLEQCWHRVPGGTARAAVETARAITEAQHSVELVGLSAFHRRPAPPPFVPPISVVSLPLPRRALYDSWHRLRRPSVERATGPVQVIHATGLAMPPATVPIVWTLHDLAWRRDPSNFTARGVRFFEAALALAKRDAAIVLCSSQATIEDALVAGLASERLRLVPLGARRSKTEHSFAEDQAVLERHRLQRRFVLSVGTSEPRKNLAVLVAAMAELDRPDIDLVLVGNSGWGEELASIVAPLGSQARLLGAASDADLDALYRTCSVFAYPSAWEGFGLPVLEAMAAGAPVVTTAGTACAEVAGDAASLVGVGDEAQLAAALAGLLDDEALAERLRSAGQLRAKEFTWERTAELTVAAYREAVS